MRNRARMARWSGVALVWTALFLFALLRGYGEAPFNALMVVVGGVFSYSCFRRARA